MPLPVKSTRLYGLLGFTVVFENGLHALQHVCPARPHHHLTADLVVTSLQHVQNLPPPSARTLSHSCPRCAARGFLMTFRAECQRFLQALGAADSAGNMLLHKAKDELMILG